ncbi:MAG: outer membrane protein assembly factor, partial [Flavobacteriaceae bacterium]|nr:outer membrane protein assembly factor [Flavobacteriaceae bacterium]
MKSVVYIFIIGFCGITFGQDISEIIIQGNHKTRSQFIQNITQVKAGNSLDSAKIELDISRLKRLPGIAHAYYKVEKTIDNSYSVTYGVEENFTIIPSANVYTTNDDEFAYRLGLYEFNGLGRNILIGGYFQRDIFNSYGINFRAPYLFSNKLGLAVNHQNLSTLEPVFLEEGVADYRYNNTSYEILGLYEFNFH